MFALKTQFLDAIDTLEIAHIHRDECRFAAEVEEARGRLSRLFSKLDEWQPIQTAPLDGTRVDLWAAAGEAGRRLTDCHWSRDRGQWELGCVTADAGLDPEERITHWRAIVGPLG